MTVVLGKVGAVTLTVQLGAVTVVLGGNRYLSIRITLASGLTRCSSSEMGTISFNLFLVPLSERGGLCENTNPKQEGIKLFYNILEKKIEGSDGAK